MILSQSFKKQLRTIGHQLNPAVIISSKGLHENLLIEMKTALDNHELIKIKLVNKNREEKKEWEKSICETLAAELIQRVGNVLLVYKKSEEQNTKLSNVVRFNIKG